MTTCLMVYTNPLPGLEDEFNDWYTNIHVPEVLQVPGVKTAQRFKISAAQVSAEQPHSYLAIYEVDSEDTAGALKRLLAAIPNMNTRPVGDAASTRMSVFDAITGVIANS